MDPSTTAHDPRALPPLGLLVLVRHGQTDWSAAGRHSGITDLPLRPDGEDNARTLTPELASFGLDRVLTSPRRRAIQTARLAGFADTQQDRDLAEWDYGAVEGMVRAEIRRVVPDWTIWTHTPAGGESGADVAARADRVIGRIEIDLQAGRSVGAFSHGHFSRVLMLRWAGLPMTAGAAFALDPGHISVLGYDRGAKVVRRWNSPPTHTQPTTRAESR